MPYRNRERRLEYARRYYIANKPKILAQARARRENGGDHANRPTEGVPEAQSQSPIR